MRQPSPRTCLVVSGAIIASLVGADLVRLATAGRLPASELRHAALAAAGLLAAVGLSSRQTRQTLDLARRLERARSHHAAVDTAPGPTPGRRAVGSPAEPVLAGPGRRAAPSPAEPAQAGPGRRAAPSPAEVLVFPARGRQVGR